MSESLKDKTVFLIGGLGFIGSNIIHKIVSETKEVIVLDTPYTCDSWKYFNNKDILDKVRLVIGDALDLEKYTDIIRESDIILNLVANMGTDEVLSKKINYDFQKNLIGRVRKNNPNAILVHFGSRLQYGTPKKLPVKETATLDPSNLYAKYKSKAEELYLESYRRYAQKTICLRISNPYGPYGIIDSGKYNIINFVVGQMMQDKTFTINGDGSQLKDYIYIEDFVDALLSLLTYPAAFGKVYNIGSGQPIKFNDAIMKVKEVVGKGKVVNDIDRDSNDCDFYMDISKIKSATGWQPKHTYESGLRLTTDYYTRTIKNNKTGDAR